MATAGDGVPTSVAAVMADADTRAQFLTFCVSAAPHSPAVQLVKDIEAWKVGGGDTAAIIRLVRRARVRLPEFDRPRTAAWWRAGHGHVSSLCAYPYAIARE